MKLLRVLKANDEQIEFVDNLMNQLSKIFNKQENDDLLKKFIEYMGEDYNKYKDYMDILDLKGLVFKDPKKVENFINLLGD